MQCSELNHCCSKQLVGVSGMWDVSPSSGYASATTSYVGAINFSETSTTTNFLPHNRLHAGTVLSTSTSHPEDRLFSTGLSSVPRIRRPQSAPVIGKRAHDFHVQASCA